MPPPRSTDPRAPPRGPRGRPAPTRRPTPPKATPTPAPTDAAKERPARPGGPRSARGRRSSPFAARFRAPTLLAPVRRRRRLRPRVVLLLDRFHGHADALGVHVLAELDSPERRHVAALASERQR